MALNDRGHELPDPTPVAAPIGFKPPPTMVEMIRMYVRREVSQDAARMEAETFEEADDFDIEDDPVDPHTPYEVVFDPPPPPPAAAPEAPSASAQSPPQAPAGPAAVQAAAAAAAGLPPQGQTP